MAGGTMNKASPALLILPLLALLGGCQPGAGSDADNGAQGELVGARIGAPFTLTDQDGKSVRWDDFAGKYRIVYFGYTYCPDVCPMDLQRIMQAFGRFEKEKPVLAAKLQPIFISIDPERDVPAVLKPYVAAFSPRLIGLTGTPAQIGRVAKDFAVMYHREEAKGGAGYMVSHSRTPYLFGPDGKPIALVPVDDPGTPGVDEGGPDAVLAALEKWVK
ncbi:SCO family protein [Sphingobium sp. AN558]|uniref:SCO family protein n=1 Tax=Sphingobium sp. AN558 TaxID=3133442 RepID=UPI0030BD795C